MEYVSPKRIMINDNGTSSLKETDTIHGKERCCRRRIVALVPIKTRHSKSRISKTRTTNAGRRHEPWIKLFSSSTNAFFEKEEESVVLGRKEFLRAHHSTCPCRQHPHQDQQKQRSLCEHCQHIWEWGKTSLSRSMMKVSRHSAAVTQQSIDNEQQFNQNSNIKSAMTSEERYQVHVQGPNAFLIRLNDEPVQDEAVIKTTISSKSSGISTETSPWIGGRWITAHNEILTIGSELVFQFQEIDDDDSVGEDEITKTVTTSALCANNEDNFAQPSSLRTDLFIGQVTVDQVVVPSPSHCDEKLNNHDLQIASSTAITSVIKQQEGLIGEASSAEINLHQSIGGYIRKPTSTIAVLKTNTSNALLCHNEIIELERQHHHQYGVYILPLGKKLPRQRIEILTKKLSRIPNVTILSSADPKNKRFRLTPHPNKGKITHIVIDETVSVKDVVSYLEFNNEEELVRALTNEGITTVTPDWIIRCPDSNMLPLKEPSLDQIWHSLDIHCKEPKVSDWIQKKKKLQESNCFASIKVVKASELVEKNGVISKINRKRKADSEVKMSLGRENEIINTSTTKACRNKKLASMFEELSKLHSDMPMEDVDKWKAYTFAIIASRLRHLDFEVNLSLLKRLESINGFGKSVIQKVKEFFDTGGTCERIRQFNHDETRIAMRNMMNIWGVGRVKAKELVDAGYSDVSQMRQGLKDAKHVLSRNAVLGVQYYEDFNEKMCRSEVQSIRDICLKFCVAKFPNCELTAMGSFRRGESSCGDVDIIILDRSHEKSTPKGGLWWLVDTLMREGHIAHHLTHWDRSVDVTDEDSNRHTFGVKADSTFTSSSSLEGADSFIGKQSGLQSYMGVFNSPHFPEKKRRIDIKFYPCQERAFAFIYFTGNTLFNRSMRQYATKVKRMKLSNCDLRPILRAPFFLGPPLKAATEKDVFDILGLVYRNPTERNGFDAVIPIEGEKNAEMFSHSLDVA